MRVMSFEFPPTLAFSWVGRGNLKLKTENSKLPHGTGGQVHPNVPRITRPEIATPKIVPTVMTLARTVFMSWIQ